YDEKVYCSFGDKVGWRQGRKWLSELQLTFSLDTHFVEHLPLAATFLYRWSGYLGYLVRGGAWQYGDWRRLARRREFSSLPQRLVELNI
ncbi:MAG: hypothetical protein O4804_01810, partial [Trichodesmium sp. St11_bin5]|nr:hypothetical protein [Trichodesmium sp. St11_bin5]